jgi:nitrate/nitrite transporter NarK
MGQRQLGGIVSPVMVGHIKDATGSTTPALYVIGAASLACAVIVMKVLPAHAMNGTRG